MASADTIPRVRRSFALAGSNRRAYIGPITVLGPAQASWSVFWPAACSLGRASAQQSFDVTVPVQDWFSPSRPRYGFILKGSFEDLDNADASSCMSRCT
jgi:hypothetical protein